MKIYFVGIYLFISISCFAQKKDKAILTDSAYLKLDRPFRLSHFNTGFDLGYESGFRPYSSKLLIGHYSLFYSIKGSYALNIDNYFAYNTANGKWNFNNTFSYRFPNMIGFAYSSELYLKNSNLYYTYGLGVAYDPGLLSLGVFYYPKSKIENNSIIGIRLILRPLYILAAVGRN